MSAAQDLAAADGTQFAAQVDVVELRWRRSQSGRAIVSAVLDNGTPVTLVGQLTHLREGDRAAVRGRWISHRRFGLQVQVASATPVDPSTVAGLQRLLVKLPGIGSAKARHLIDRYGVEVLAALDADPEQTLRAVPGVSPAGARSAAEAWREWRRERRLYLLMAEHGLVDALPALRHRFGDAAFDHLRANPWLLAGLPGASMANADAIAASLGAPPDSPLRRHAVIANAMRDVLADGHTCVPVDYLLQRARPAAPDLSVNDVAAMAQQRQLVVGAGYVWTPRTEHDERVAAERIAALAGARAASRVDVPPSPAGGLTDEQWHGVRAAFASGVSVVCGGPGTGKTHMVQTIARIATAAGWTVALCAPTGRAARRIAQATGLQASTVHRLLDWSRGEAPGPARDATHPIDADLVVVDEASMLDAHLAAQLLAAVRDGSRVVFVGDPDQLPSVGAGRFLADLIDSGTVTTTRLTVVQRQAQRSQIIRAAHAINHGSAPTGERPSDPDALWDFFWVAEPDPEALVATVTDMVARRLPAHYDLDPLRDILVMAPAKKGPAGVARLNESIGARLNPTGARIPNSRLRVGDKAMWTANDEDLELANGMMLLIEGFDAASREVHVLDEDGRPLTLPAQRLRDLQPGWAITAHKSQGGETAVAVTVLHRAETHPALLTREMLYTAVTRARQASIVIGEPAAYEACVATVGAQRCTGLVARLHSTLGASGR